MGTVYQAFDADTGELVALKVLRSKEPAQVARFKNEFRGLADVQHRNLVRLGELFAADDNWFFSMEYVDGRHFLAHVRDDVLEHTTPVTGDSGSADTLEARSVAQRWSTPDALCDETRLRDCLRQLVSGVSALHAAGIVHRDLKPHNVLVAQDGRVVILDFGLARGPQAADTSDGHVLGTAFYMAPEQAITSKVGPEADWYSVGVMLYEALTGRLPHAGAAIQTLIDKQHQEPTPPKELFPELPNDLNELCVKLLRVEPHRRPTSNEILRSVGAQSASVNHTSNSTFTQSVPFFGRRRELDALVAAHQKARQGTAQALFVEGESGVGKSLLTRTFSEELDGAIVLTGRCYEREAVPYKGFDGVVESLSQRLARMNQVDVALLLSGEAGLVARTFPVLRRVQAIARAPEPKIANPAEVRVRAFAGLRRIFAKLAETHDVVVCIDDLQWADADSLALLGELLHPTHAPPILFVGTLRPALSADSPNARALDELLVAFGPGGRRIRLEALSADEAEELAVYLLSRSGAASNINPAHIAREAGGHPLFVQELIRHAIATSDSGAAPIRLDEALLARTATLDPRAQLFLRLLVVASAPLRLDTVGEAMSAEASELRRLCAQLRLEHLVRTTGLRDRDRAEPYHDRVREAVRKALPAGELKQTHMLLVAALQASGEAARNSQLLVRHLEGAGDLERAAREATKAAGFAEETLAFDRAAQLYGTALRLGSFDDERSRRLTAQRARALAMAGRSVEAGEVFEVCASQTSGSARLEFSRHAAEQFLTGGDVERGMTVLRDVLDEHGLALPATPSRAIASLLWHRARLRIRGLSWKPRDLAEVAPATRERLDLYRVIALCLGFTDNVRGSLFQTRWTHLALNEGEPSHVFRVLCFHALMLASEGNRKEARARRVLRAAKVESVDDPYLINWHRVITAFIGYLTGRVEGMLEEASKGEDYFRDEAAGARWELNHTRIVRLLLMRVTGRFGELTDQAEEYWRDALRRGDRFAAATMSSLASVAWLASGNPDRARSMLQSSQWTPPETGFPHLQHYYRARAYLEIALYEGVREIAVDGDLEPDLREVEASLLRRVLTVRVETRFGLARYYLATGQNEKALRMGKLLLRENAPYPRVFGRVVRGCVASADGQRELSLTNFRRARHIARETGMMHWVALIDRKLHTIDDTTGGPDTSEAWFTEQRIAEPQKLLRVFIPDGVLT